MSELLYRRMAAALEQDEALAQAALLRRTHDFFNFFPHLRGRFEYPADLAQAAVLVPVIDRAGGATILLTYRTDSMPTHPGEIVFPGGGSKAGDRSLSDTALREAEEEIGLARECVMVAGFLDARPMGPKYRVQPVVGIAPADTQCTHCAREVASVFEIPLALVLDKSRYTTEPVESAHGRVPAILNLHYGEHRIWGATAEILFDLCEKILARESAG